MTLMAPATVSQPVAPRNPPITGYGTKRITRPARAIPSPHSKIPASALPIAMTISVGSSRWGPAPLAMSRPISEAASPAVTAEVDVSGPAMAKGSELRSATTNALTAVDRNVTAIP